MNAPDSGSIIPNQCVWLQDWESGTETTLENAWRGVIAWEYIDRVTGVCTLGAGFTRAFGYKEVSLRTPQYTCLTCPPFVVGRDMGLSRACLQYEHYPPPPPLVTKLHLSSSESGSEFLSPPPPPSNLRPTLTPYRLRRSVGSPSLLPGTIGLATLRTHSNELWMDPR